MPETTDNLVLIINPSERLEAEKEAYPDFVTHVTQFFSLVLRLPNIEGKTSYRTQIKLLQQETERRKFSLSQLLQISDVVVETEEELSLFINGYTTLSNILGETIRHIDDSSGASSSQTQP